MAGSSPGTEGSSVGAVLLELREAEHGGVPQDVHAQLSECEHANAALSAQLEVTRSRLRQQAEAADASTKAAESALNGLRQKVATQAHQLKAKEAETRRLQERLSQDLSERDAAQKLRERQVFQEVHRRAPRQQSAADARNLEVIEIYESRRRAMQAEIDELRASMGHLSEELCAKENLIARKDAFNSWRTPDAGDLLATLQDAQNEASSAREAHQQAEARAADLLREARHATAVAEREAEMERARSASLELELSARPSPKQWNEAKATIERLHATFPSSSDRLPSDTSPRSHPAVDSADAIRRDREVHALGLHALQSMPSADMIEILQVRAGPDLSIARCLIVRPHAHACSTQLRLKPPTHHPDRAL